MYGMQEVIHKKCSGVKGKLKNGINFRCPVCLGQVQSSAKEDVEEVSMNQGEVLESVKNFCYLGDMLGLKN